MELRDYQIDAKNKIFAELSGNASSTLCVMPTGTGKTQVFLSVMNEWPQGQVLSLAHREELVWQPFDRWKQITGEFGEIEMAEFQRSRNSTARATFASKDSLYQMKRLKRAFPDPKSVGLIVIDEAHHAVKFNRTYQAVLDYFSVNPDLRILGVTATPDRADEEALGQTFDSVAFDYPLLDPLGGPSAISDGWLVPITQEYVVVDGLDFNNISSRGGDFVDADLERELLKEKILHRITSPTMDLANGQTLVFSAGVKQASRMTEIFNRYKAANAYCLVSRVDHDDTHDAVINSRDKQARRRMLRRFADNEFQFLVNVGCLTEGVDLPNCSTVVVGRMTRSRALYSQMVGRGTRILPGVVEGDGWKLDTPEKRKAAIAASNKTSLRVLDFVGNSRHSLISAADILGGSYSDEVVAKAKENMTAERDPHDPWEVAEELRKAAAEVLEDHKRRSSITAKASYSTQLIGVFGALGVVASREPGWHKGRQPTTKQSAALARFKVEPHVIDRMSFWQANKMLDNLIGRAKEKQATYKQSKLLAKYGESTDVSFKEACHKIDKIAQNGWKPLRS